LSQIKIKVQFNSVYFISPNITNYKFASKGFTICRHRTQDLTPDQEKLPRNRKNPFTGKKGRKVMPFSETV